MSTDEVQPQEWNKEPESSLIYLFASEEGSAALSLALSAHREHSRYPGSISSSLVFTERNIKRSNVAELWRRNQANSEEEEDSDDARLTLQLMNVESLFPDLMRSVYCLAPLIKHLPLQLFWVIKRCEDHLIRIKSSATEALFALLLSSN